jgi:hypothetical protein
MCGVQTPNDQDSDYEIPLGLVLLAREDVVKLDVMAFGTRLQQVSEHGHKRVTASAQGPESDARWRVVPGVPRALGQDAQVLDQTIHHPGRQQLDVVRCDIYQRRRRRHLWGHQWVARLKLTRQSQSWQRHAVSGKRTRCSYGGLGDGHAGSAHARLTFGDRTQARQRDVNHRRR